MEIISDDKAATDRIAAEDILIAFFNAPWVGPGRLARPFVESVAASLSVRAVEIDVDQCKVTAQSLDIQSAPTTILFKKGKVMTSIVGARPEHAIRREIQTAMGR